jgi:tRNA (mo5U34)-methyltransferase
MSGEAVRSLREEVDVLDWYHTLELAPGVETPGWFDLRDLVQKMRFPPSLEGHRCLDIGTFDGFWAFEMERRGADEVVAIDVLDPLEWDWPAASSQQAIEAIGKRKARGAGFELAGRELGSRVRRLELSVYDLDPDEIGRFDLIYLGSLLLHLRDPVGALERVRAVCSGSFILCDAIDAPLSIAFRRRPIADLDAVGRPWWWKPNLAALVRMVESAGFELVRTPTKVRMRPGPGHPPRRLNPRAMTSHVGRVETMRAWLGDPHAIVHAKPIDA